MHNLWNLKKGDSLSMARKKFKVEKLENFRLPSSKEDSARWAFLRNGRRDYVLYMVKKNGRLSHTLEEAIIDKTKNQWWRNFQAGRKL